MATEMEQSDLTKEIAAQYKVPVGELIKTVKAICFPSGAASDAQLFVFLNAARKLDLDPLNKEIYAFVSSGKLQVIVGFDGWIKLATRNAQFGGFEFTDIHDDKGALVAVTCKMYRKDWKVAGEATEYLSECKGSTDPWNKWPHRMLRNKAYIQCARMTFGFAEAVDPDEAERIATPDSWSNGDGHEPHLAIETTATHVEEGSSPAAGAASAEALPPHAEPASTGGIPPAQPEKKTRGRPKKDASAGSAASLPSSEQAGPQAEVLPADSLVARRQLATLAAKLPANRIVILCGQFGVAKLDDLTDEQCVAAVARLERRK